MHKTLLITGLLCGSLVLASNAGARDVLLRPGANDTVTTSRSGAADTPRAVSSNTQGMSVEERIARLERILESQGLVDMLLRLDSLQSEVQALRGEIELQAHQVEELKQRQRDLYVDIDRRLLNLERHGSGGAASTEAPVVSRPASTPASTAGASRGNTTVTAAAAPAANTEAEQQAYQKAFDQLRDLRYEQAVAAFREFIGKYPTGRYAHIAQYWIGEANYAQRKYEQAIDDYRALVDKYPNSPKLAEAMLKIGYSQYELGKLNEAETTLNQLVKAYPGTTEAGQAQNLIQKIRLKR